MGVNGLYMVREARMQYIPCYILVRLIKEKIKMKKILRFLTVCFYYRFKVIDSCKQAEERGLKFDNNVYGDAINIWNCRSFWYDEYNYRYRCAELHE